MTTRLLLFLWMFQSQPLQQQMEQEFRRQQTQLEQMQNQFQQEMGRVRDLIEKQQQAPKTPGCSAELRWVTGGQDVKVPTNAEAVVPMNLFSTVSRPSNACLNAEVTLSASYLDPAENLVCTGVIENIAVQTNLAQSINLDVRPWNLREFARWHNEPAQVNSGTKRLICLNPEGTAEATPEELGRVASVRVRTTVLPASGGMASVEFKLRLR